MVWGESTRRDIGGAFSLGTHRGRHRRKSACTCARSPPCRPRGPARTLEIKGHGREERMHGTTYGTESSAQRLGALCAIVAPHRLAVPLPLNTANRIWAEDLEMLANWKAEYGVRLRKRETVEESIMGQLDLFLQRDSLPLFVEENLQCTEHKSKRNRVPDLILPKRQGTKVKDPNHQRIIVSQ
jgi:hypothetical protein